MINPALTGEKSESKLMDLQIAVSKKYIGSYLAIFNFRTMLQDEFKMLNHCIAPLLVIYFYAGSRVGKETFRFYPGQKQQTRGKGTL